MSCADPRADVSKFFNIKMGEALAVRNVGGRLSPSAVNDIVALDRLFTFTQLTIIHHTDCGCLQFTNEQVRELVKQRDPSVDVAALDFGAFTDVAGSVREDLEKLKGVSFIRPELRDGARGFVYDIKTGKLSEVQQ